MHGKRSIKFVRLTKIKFRKINPCNNYLSIGPTLIHYRSQSFNKRVKPILEYISQLKFESIFISTTIIKEEF